jgi:hypothetical protein
MDGFICICSVDYVVTLHVVNEIYICYSIDGCDRAISQHYYCSVFLLMAFAINLIKYIS